MGLLNMFKKKNEIERLNDEFDRNYDMLSKSIAEREKKEQQEREGYTKIVDGLSGGLSQFDRAPGSTRAYSVASDTAKVIYGKLGIDNDKKVSQVNFDYEENSLEYFNKKFPQYNELKNIISSVENGTISPEMFKKVNVLTKLCKERYPGFTLNDLLIPYLMEKQSMGLTTMDESIFLSNKNDFALLGGYSQKEYNLSILYYISMNGALFGLQGEESKKFIDSFKNTFALCRQFVDVNEESKSSFGR